MYGKKGLTSVLFLLIWISVSCSQPAPTPLPLPTSAIVAALPSPSATSLPPTIDLAELAGAPLPTPVPPTRPPTATATAVTPQVGVTSPDSGSDIVLGDEVRIRGLMQKQDNQSVWLALLSGNGRLLIETEAAISDQTWEVEFTVPPFVSGAANLEATIRDENGEVVAENRVPVNLTVDTNTADRYLAMTRPLREETAVSGFNLFFDGMVYRPVDSVITISVWVDDCQTRVARQSFVLGRSVYPIYWQGFTVIPGSIAGPGCAVAHTGEPGSEAWREAVMLINILPPDDTEAKGVLIGNPPPDSHVTAGRELYLYGTALNVSEKPVSVTVLMENGRIISQSTAPADYWGYWEFRVTLPPDVSGPAQVTVSTGDTGSDAYAEAQILIHVDPAPTPES